MTINGFLKKMKRTWILGSAIGVASLSLAFSMKADAKINEPVGEILENVDGTDEDILNAALVAQGEYSGCSWEFYDNGHLKVRSVRADSNLTNYPWSQYSDKIRSVDIDVPYSSHLSCMFYGCWRLEKAKVKIDRTSGSAYEMFSCRNYDHPNSHLVELDVSGLNTAGITDMSYMFYGCTAIKSLDLGKWDTSNVTQMNYMFYGCENLKTVNLGSFNTKNVKSMSYMFGDCYSLGDLNLSGFNTSNLKYATGMFGYCESMKKITLSGWDVRNLVRTDDMFCHCEYLESVALDGWSTPKLEMMDGMFSGCYYLRNLNLSGLYTGNVKNMSSLFCECNNLRTLKLDNWNTSNVVNMESMFKGCNALGNLDLKSFNTANVENMSSMFAECYLLYNVAIGTFNTSRVTSMSNMFRDCRSLKKLDLKIFSTGRLKYMHSMFENCYSLEDVNLRSFRTPSLLSIHNLFSNCRSIKMIDLSTIDLANLPAQESGSYSTTFSMFGNCTNLITVKTPKNLKKQYYLNGNWYRDDKNVGINEIPQKLSYSIVIHRQEEENKFVDVRLDGWQYNSVKNVYDKKYMSGKGFTNDNQKLIIFDADTPMTRAEFVQTLYNYAGKPSVKYTNAFKDVPKGKWFTNAILWASNKKLVSGVGNKKFGVDDKITRQDMVTILYKYAKDTKSSYVSNASKFKLTGFTDYTQVASYATTPMKWATGNKIMNGKPTQQTKLKLVPAGNATRAECAAILSNYINFIKKIK